MLSIQLRSRTALVTRISALILALLPLAVWAATSDSQSLHWFQMTMELFGGLALFLFGMEQMSDALKASAGDQMKNLLSKLTTNRFSAAISGAAVTSIIQSSSVTTVLVVGFVSAGLMTLSQSIGVIMGSNIGTTITAQIVAFKVEKAALLMIALGFAMLFLSNKEKMQHYGNMLMGLGLVFFGMGIMSEGMSPLRSYEPFINLMASMEKPLLGILVAAAFTALVQSSSATTGIVIVMASQGFISLPAGIALAFGANIGTCVTALLAAIGKPTEARRAAAIHIIFNIAGVFLWLWFIPQLAWLVSYISPSANNLTGIDKLAAEVPRQIANAHTIFNIANTLIFIGFTTHFGRLVEYLLPEKVTSKKAIIKPLYLDNELLETPALALDMVRRELAHLASIVDTMLAKTGDAFRERDATKFDEIAKMDDQADILHAEITDYIRKLTVQNLTEQENDSLMRYLSINEDLERIGDVIETNLVEVGKEAVRLKLRATETERTVLSQLYYQLREALTDTHHIALNDDELAAQDILHMKDNINQLVREAIEMQAVRLKQEGAENIDVTHMENELIDSMKRIYSLAKRIAKLSLPKNLFQEPD
ncbi:Na/Pi cotransporter family protein [Thalassotalea euphylliae]|uniref:Na/Pi cotransporter family protein n=1 Tax=Thalassotalea euphylliae TaxID=1655234 RepID=A0A3E0TUJ5_9GAMM|nr:Na/Pi cotransporter family protein [Thalassotalea euphylliae]REL28114.1 Na/Pi cotransporter family protein [Thalassotalea euphylliae]